MVDRPDQGAKRAPKLPSAEKEKSDEICVYYLWQFCKNKNNCSMIHYDLPYRWQIRTSNGWKDLPRREEIEQAYCDPNITRFPDLGLDFTTLTSATSPIRRLSTPSSVTKEPKFVMTTMWLWYWKSDQGQWFEYGKQAIPALKSILKKPEKNNQIQPATVTSEDLENLYQADPTGNVQFEAGSQQYVLSFKYMTQTNENYSTQREVRRRPKFVSSEDVRTKKGHTAAATTITTAVLRKMERGVE
ncbi:PREDICTED: poly [ADP-ribose] polymerase 12-like [Thamnophis sirtalis]|uniref:Poly [ADP-ribose] polymerase 12-like n=1 Tax=Thamnophis sirtalis TaxID=35019 RepID=A0A6I9YKE4_9SAUR|nr:PREDICTED: poly [ADP-ribose] polymerase 12-like [Thamnophis sirtalis]